MIARRKKIDELRILKDLFLKDMPIDDTKIKNVEDYFSRMEKAIVNNEPIQRDEFHSPDDKSVSGGRVYKYYPSVSPEKLESGHPKPSFRPDMDYREGKPSILPTTENKPPTIKNVEHVSHSA